MNLTGVVSTDHAMPQQKIVSDTEEALASLQAIAIISMPIAHSDAMIAKSDNMVKALICLLTHCRS